MVYLDANNDGQLDDGELSTTTGASGRYAFYDFAGVTFPANYTVRVVVPAHVLQTGPNTSYTVTVRASRTRRSSGTSSSADWGASRARYSATASTRPTASTCWPVRPSPLPGRQVYATVEVANFPDFPDDGPNASLYRFAGTAGYGSDASGNPALVPAVVNSDGSDAAGAAWLATPITVDRGFEATFQWSSSSEGFAFVLQPGSNTALGGNFGNLGYGGLANSLAIEFDMFQNGSGFNDPDGNHISVHINGSADENDSANVLGRLDSGPLDFRLSDSAVHTARIVYLPGVLQIFLNGSQTPSMTISVSLPTILGGANTPAYVGFTASAISANASTSILNFEASAKSWASPRRPPTVRTRSTTSCRIRPTRSSSRCRKGGGSSRRDRRTRRTSRTDSISPPMPTTPCSLPPLSRWMSTATATTTWSTP